LKKIPGVRANADIFTGTATVILVMGAGRWASNFSHDFLTSGR